MANHQYTNTYSPAPNRLYNPGDILLTKGTAALDRLIQFGERIRDGKIASQYNHAAYILNSSGLILEAGGKGIVYGHVSDYPVEDTLIISNFLSPPNTQQAIRFALSCAPVDNKPKVKYGYLTDVSIGIDLLTPGFVHFRSGNTLICSQFVAKCLEHGGWICPKLDTSHVMPSDLYLYLVKHQLKWVK